jgi:hypothetical protein
LQNEPDPRRLGHAPIIIDDSRHRAVHSRAPIAVFQ